MNQNSVNPKCVESKKGVNLFDIFAKSVFK